MGILIFQKLGFFNYFLIFQILKSFPNSEMDIPNQKVPFTKMFLPFSKPIYGRNFMSID